MESTAANATTSAKHHGRDWLEKLARLGYAARGVLYVIIGGLAFFAAIGEGGETTGTRGAIQKVLEAPGGWVLVLIIALGLLGYSAWRICQSVLDADGEGNDGRAMVKRTGYFVSGIAHMLLAIWAGKLALQGALQDDSEGSKESMVATLMSQPFGQWLVGAVGLILIGVGIYQFTKGREEKFEKDFTWNQEQRRKFLPFCKFGLYTRGVIFAIIGGFVVYAAITTDPSEAGGTQEALQWLHGQAYGPWLLGIIALGLICFGIYSGVAAMYRRVHPPV